MAVRMNEELRKRFIAAAYKEGTTASDLVRAFALWYLGEGPLPNPSRVDGASIEGLSD